MGQRIARGIGVLIAVFALMLAGARALGSAQRGGSQLALSVFQDRQWSSYVVLADTQHHTLVRLRQPESPGAPLAWLDADHLLLADDETATRLIVEYTIYAVGGEAVRFAEPSACLRHTLAGRGRYLTCIGHERRTFLIYDRAQAAALQTATPRAIPSASAIYSYALSPDGQRAALMTRSNRSTDLVLLDTASGQTRMLGHVQLIATPSWSPDGRLLAYLAQGTRSTEVHIYHSPDAALLVRADLHAAYTGGVLAWEENAGLTLYLRRGSRADLRLLRLAEEGVHTLQDNIDIAGLPVWSPDGLQLAFYDSIHYRFTLRSRLHGFEEYRLPANMSAQSPARWRPCQESGC